MSSKLGKLIAVHPTSPASLQRAAIVTALAFLFFLAGLILYLIRQNFLYFILATGFLIVQIFTMVGLWMQKRNAVSIYSNGLLYRKRSVAWEEIAGLHEPSEGGLKIDLNNSETLLIPAYVQGIDRIAAFIRRSSEFHL